MNTDWTPVPADSARSITFFLHKNVSPLEVMEETSSSPLELTRFVKSASQSHFECEISLKWHLELYGADEPRAGQIIEIRLNDQQLYVGIVDSIRDFSLKSGEKHMKLVTRSRDSMPLWRHTPRVSDLYPVGTPVAYICRQIAIMLGLVDQEIDIPDGLMYTVHSNTQLADSVPWQMLTTLLQSSGLEPYVNSRGKLKTISRDTQRPSDIVLDDNRRLVSVQGNTSRSSVSEVRIKWLDPNLTEVAQQAQALDKATITAGFFQIHQKKDVLFSSDGRQRARDTYLVIKQSANSGLLPVCDETYEQLSETKGLIHLKTTFWVPVLATGAMATKFAAHELSDIAPTFGGPTIIVGRRIEYFADAVLFLTMMSVGTGVYEIWGTPFDYVHARNTTAAYNKNVNPWEINAEEIETDFVMDEAQALEFAVRELLYKVRSASGWSLKIIDDPRIEVGDIVELANGIRIYVTGFQRDLSHAAGAFLDIQGFPVPLVNGNTSIEP